VLSEGLKAAVEGLRLDGLKQFVYGLCVVAIVLFRPEGLWPWLAKRLGLDREKEDGE